MAMLNALTASSSLNHSFSSSSSSSSSLFPVFSRIPSNVFRLPSSLSPSAVRNNKAFLHHCFPSKLHFLPIEPLQNQESESESSDSSESEAAEIVGTRSETLLYSFSHLPLIFLAALPGAGTVKTLFRPFVEIVKSFDLPDWLVHWGHPGNMAVVLFAMGGYGSYLGFRIRYSDDAEEKANAKDLHPKLLAGMFFFFALGATGGVTSLLTSDKPIFESPHAVTGLIGLSLLTIQTILPTLFKGNPGLRNVHGILGSGIMTLFLIHAALGLQLGLSS